MNIKRLLTLLVVLILGISLGVAFTCHPISSIPPALYKTETYFSPNGGVAANIIKAINNAKSSIDLAIFDLTSNDIASSLEKAQKRDVKIRIIADSRQAKGARSIIQALINEGFNVRIAHGIGRGIMHNKFAIFDNKLLVTGSYNWTNNAEHFNYENAIFTPDPETIKKYQQNFDKIWKM